MPDPSMPQEIPNDLRAQVELARKLGVHLYLQNEASAIGTKTMLAHVPSAERGSIRGYLTMREEPADRGGDTWLVSFFTAGDPPSIAFRARVSTQPGAQPAFEALDPPEPAAGGARLFIRARQTALSALPDTPQLINSVILPGSVIGHDGVLVYMLAGTRQPNVAVFGKHWRALVSPDGAKVTRLEPLSREIIEIPLDVPDQPGAEIVALTITHLVTEHPMETHVFASLFYRKQVYVGTSRGVWYIKGDEISFLGPLEPRTAAQSDG